MKPTQEQKAQAVMNALEECDSRWEGGPHRWAPYSDAYEFCYYCDQLRRILKDTNDRTDRANA